MYFQVDMKNPECCKTFRILLVIKLLHHRQGGAGEVQQQAEEHAQGDAGKGRDHPQAAAAGEFAGHIQPAQA